MNFSSFSNVNLTHHVLWLHCNGLVCSNPFVLRFQLSPYLNVNPSYVQTPEFIVNQEQKKGRIEQSFAGIGASVISGGAAGGAYGLYDGLRQTADTGMKGASRRTQVMNYTVKSGKLFHKCE